MILRNGSRVVRLSLRLLLGPRRHAPLIIASKGGAVKKLILLALLIGVGVMVVRNMSGEHHHH